MNRLGDFNGQDLSDSILEGLWRSPFDQLDDDGSRLGPRPAMKEGVERFMITDINNPAAGAQAQSQMPLMFDAWGNTSTRHSAYAGAVDTATLRFNHVPGGSNVLYLDGHVSFHKLNSGFPILMPTANDLKGIHPDAFAVTFTSYWIQLAGGWG